MSIKTPLSNPMRKKGKDKAKAKESLYVFFTLPGNFIAANFTGQQ